MAATKHYLAIEAVSGWFDLDDEQLADLILDYGMKYARGRYSLYTPERGESYIETPAFWQWWHREWNNKDDVILQIIEKKEERFKYKCSEDYVTDVWAFYRAFHNPIQMINERAAPRYVRNLAEELLDKKLQVNQWQRKQLV